MNSNSESGLTLLEMMVAVALLLMIVTGLTMMFMQTQRAFKGGLGQVDVFESGRATMDMIARDLEQMTPSGDVLNVNFYLTLGTLTKPPLIDKTTDTNFIRDMFVLTHGSDWQGVSYQVFDTNSTGWTNLVVGTLYRHATNTARIQGSYLFTNFNSIDLRDYHRVIDGVVRLQVRVYDTAGFEILTTNGLSPDVRMVWQPVQPVDGCGLWSYEFRNNEVPGYLEIELGILEPSAVELMRLYTDYSSQVNFVQKNSGKIHIFRQQIPIRALSR